MRSLPPAPGPAGRALAGLLAFALASAVVLLTSSRPAEAHGTLAMSTPASGATVTEPPTAVELYFTEQVAANAYFTITGPGGGRVDGGWRQGSPRPLDKPVREYLLVNGKFEPKEYTTGFPAVVTLTHLPAAGQYAVSYLSVASDGEPVRGTMTFRYTGRATAAPQGWRPPVDQPDPALVAAAEQHATSGHTAGPASGGPAASTVPPSPSAAVAAASPSAATSDDDGGLGWLAWTGGAVVVVAAVGFASWRRRPVPAGRPTARSGGRSRVPGTAPRRGAGARTARPKAAAGRQGVTRAATAARAVLLDPVAAPPAEEAAPTPGARLNNTALALLVGGLVVALLAGFGLGRLGRGTPSGDGVAAAPPATGSAVSAGDGHQHGPGTGAHTHPGDGGAAQAQAQVTGLSVNSGGYTLQPVARTQPAGAQADYRFRIVGTDGQPATRFAVVHDKQLHMVVVGRDLSGYQHLHPTMEADGTWSVPLTLARPGGYRIYADFSVTGPDGTALPLVLGVDHQVPGAHTPAPLPPAQPQATGGPFTVTMGGTPTVGVTVPLSFRLDGVEPARLERYLGAYGHLVVVREGDLGYVHVHPEQELVDGTVRFWLTAPSAGRYRAFFDFQVDGKVHTAQYTLDLP
ncbi:copper resistance protein CopC [Micromonospora sp. NPDC051925]|uniref:copper resistance protein CopC n=1 Tax=Micromonospora sp. NPDC051925 TaxID=3364288 RepID=UPI0037C81DF4